MFDPAPLAARLLRARREATCIPCPAPGFAPPDEAGAYAVQDLVAAALGPVHGWKVGASGPGATPSAAPLHAATIFTGDTALPPGLCRFHGIEGEIAWQLGRDLPAACSMDELRAAVTALHPVIEIVDTRFCRPASQAPLAHLADQGSHGALIVGPAFTNWQDFDAEAETVRVELNGRLHVETPTRNAAGDTLRLLLWLAAHAAGRGHPLRKGDIITTGSLTGAPFVEPRTVARVAFSTLGEVTATIP
ncbi:fumarylacetoacetate hydrolase family protein [Acidomonas methanolica]|uniref:2-oxopent-4-enoate hydratase n=1 Tax=Acidomonas methanolica NBRC 104435 TaxID=1231351 RepID=A0A023D5N5_ACIMT|nr:fumarylacetoacetate hydrolase family protein [Acidomonas methanolica]MBU2654716.1 fumarylacetoacetate hydrolase family protein [Acidomonas methanolica]TCS27282.1 2-keto-4-pentenoate hydratase [Acidomonas methanolica]GAJ29463.1 2-oxopent-4-enoate hydratase [Acidomonas methanolica NBRC 104435]GBQ59187.1 2-oxopent-4-enoate hydratase [Acidomonas methanolica]GEL00131.1 hypothetical protein AME01nite_26290 [Acidomonas methanolica NBRC 104435]